MRARRCLGVQSHGAQLPPDIFEYFFFKTVSSSISISSTMYGKYLEVFIHLEILMLHVGNLFLSYFAKKQFLFDSFLVASKNV